MTESKLKKLNSILKDLKSFVVAFSGGVDSSFLLYTAHSIGNLKVLAVTLRTPYIPSHEISEALEFTDAYAINHKIIDLEVPEIIKHNPVERCYCVKRFSLLRLLNRQGKTVTNMCSMHKCRRYPRLQTRITGVEGDGYQESAVRSRAYQKGNKGTYERCRP